MYMIIRRRHPPTASVIVELLRAQTITDVSRHDEFAKAVGPEWYGWSKGAHEEGAIITGRVGARASGFGYEFGCWIDCGLRSTSFGGRYLGGRDR